MSEDRIERETLIEASLERVRSLAAEPGFRVTVSEALRGKAVEDNAGGRRQELDALKARAEQPSA